MSSGQRPRWPAFYPDMKVRGRHRHRKGRVLVYTSNWEPVWPPTIDGHDIRYATFTWQTSEGTRQFGGELWTEVQQ
ncbi:hypothetical protein HOT94_gp095 [Gordonia phage Phistory]|uniref:Uncharacterized protein n=1 Tax=Gordonia phage Phistory TaxID=2301694 RepID=A0A385DZ18_9CAUD|nr:hypothetical protein HOT94_gp095 [Gordonia phage Phistory]AXQ64800.1 hypothetical protein SEA_PHISTORY_95 [Gordonia phage Phistory]